MKVLNKIISLLTFLEKWICIICLGIMFLVGSLEIIARNLFRHSFIWSQEVIIIFLVWEVYMAAGYIFNTGRLINVDFLYSNVGPSVQKVFDVIGDIVTMIVLVIVVYYGWQFQSVQAKFLTNALRLPNNIHSIPLVLVSVSMILRIIQKYLSMIFREGGTES